MGQHWLISLTIVLSGTPASGVHAGGIIVDTRNGTLLSVENLGLSGEFYLTQFALSPDGEWLAVALTEGESRQVVGLYLTPDEVLTAGRMIESSDLWVAGWHIIGRILTHTDPPAVIFRNESTGTLSVALLPLTDGSPGSPLRGAGKLLAATAGSIMATAADNSALVLQFDLEGNLLNTLDLSSQYESVPVAQAAAGRIYLAVMGHQSRENNACVYGIVEWTPGSGSQALRHKLKTWLS